MAISASKLRQGMARRGNSVPVAMLYGRIRRRRGSNGQDRSNRLEMAFKGYSSCPPECVRAQKHESPPDFDGLVRIGLLVDYAPANTDAIASSASLPSFSAT